MYNSRTFLREEAIDSSFAAVDSLLLKTHNMSLLILSSGIGKDTRLWARQLDGILYLHTLAKENVPYFQQLSRQVDKNQH